MRSRSLGDASNYRWLGAGYGSTNTSATRSCSARGGASRSRRLRTPASTHGRLRGGRVTTATVAECAVKVSRNLGSCQQPNGSVRALAETRGAHVQPGDGHRGVLPSASERHEREHGNRAELPGPRRGRREGPRAPTTRRTRGRRRRGRSPTGGGTTAVMEPVPTPERWRARSARRSMPSSPDRGVRCPAAQCHE